MFVSQWASEGMDLPSLNFTTVDSAEGLLAGYQWQDAHDFTPQFLFGFGLTGRAAVFLLTL